MGKGAKGMFDVQCPCCHSTLRVDPETKAVISHTEAEKPKVVEDLAEAARRLQGEAARRDEAFRKSMEQHKSHGDVLNKKFDELLKQAKEKPEEAPPKRPFDWD